MPKLHVGVLLALLAAAPHGAEVTALAPLSGGIVFATDVVPVPPTATLWVSRGTPESTLPVVHFLHGAIDLVQTEGSRAVFRFFPSDTAPVELWTTDGTAAGTSRFAAGIGLTANPEAFPAVAGRVFFLQPSSAGSTALWVTDGAPPRLLRDFGAGLGSGGPLSQTAFAGRLLFSARSSPSAAPLFLSDGTAAGTQPISGEANFAETFTRVGNLAFFAAGPKLNPSPGNLPARDGLWRTDGTPAGTVRLADIQGFAAPKPLGQLLLFTGGQRLVPFGIDLELWKSDGTAQGTAVVDPINPYDVDTGFHDICVGASSNPGPGILVGGRLLFPADDGVHGRELWRTDGTGKGTLRLGDINPGPAASSPGPFTIVGDQVFFGADDGVHGRELWAMPLADVLHPLG